MIIQSLRQHWPSRKMEWLGSGFLMSWGIYVLLHPELFTQDATAQVFAGLAALTDSFSPYPALVWGGLAFAVGLARAVALFINGAYVRTPAIRVVTSFVSIFILTQICLGLFDSGVPNTGLVVYPWLIVADLISAYRAAVDVVYAETVRKTEKEGRSGISGSSIRPAFRSF